MQKKLLIASAIFAATALLAACENKPVATDAEQTAPASTIDGPVIAPEVTAPEVTAPEVTAPEAAPVEETQPVGPVTTD
ncbi:MAG: hypothetical protein ACNA7Y_03095 [Gammaproteobacteria bacterium]